MLVGVRLRNPAQRRVRFKISTRPPPPPDYPRSLCAIIAHDEHLNHENTNHTTAASPFDNSDRAQLDNLLAYSSGMARIDYGGYILVRLRRLLHHELRRRNANRDPFSLQPIEDLLVSKGASERGASPKNERPKTR